jgi:hypothetical protein
MVGMIDSPRLGKRLRLWWQNATFALVYLH